MTIAIPLLGPVEEEDTRILVHVVFIVQIFISCCTQVDLQRLIS